MSEETVAVEVVFVPASGDPFVCSLTLPSGSTVADAVLASGLASVHPGLAWQAPGNLGVFGERVSAGHVLRMGDRVEVYRALLIEPMQARRVRAARGKG